MLMGGKKESVNYDQGIKVTHHVVIQTRCTVPATIRATSSATTTAKRRYNKNQKVKTIDKDYRKP
jgi:hypothetical protein